jgi:tetratricopeptide (TPR) repeat protein
MELLRFCHWRAQKRERSGAEKGLALAAALVTIPQYAKEVWWMKAEILQSINKFAEAISAFQSADSPPRTLWKIADCYVALGKREQAIAQLREVENFFQNEASQAAWRIACIYREAGDQKQYVAQMRGVLKRYPKSKESSSAHRELERLGFKIGGGVDAE